MYSDTLTINTLFETTMYSHSSCNQDTEYVSNTYVLYIGHLSNQDIPIFRTSGHQDIPMQWNP